MNLRISVFCFDLLPLDLRLEGSPEQGERTMPLDPPEPGFDVEQRRSEDPGASDPGGRPSPPGRSTGPAPAAPPVRAYRGPARRVTSSCRRSPTARRPRGMRAWITATRGSRSSTPG